MYADRHGFRAVLSRLPHDLASDGFEISAWHG